MENNCKYKLSKEVVQLKEVVYLKKVKFFTYRLIYIELEWIVE